MCKNAYIDRKKKMDEIDNKYSTREYRQKDLAKEYGMSMHEVRIVTKALGYEHGKKKTPENLNPGQLSNLVSDLEELSFLDNYELKEREP